MLSLHTTLQAAIDLLPEAVIVLTRETRIVAANLQVYALLGYQPEELVGQDLDMLTPERFRKQHASYFYHYFEAPVKRRMGSGKDLFALCKDGREIDVDVALAPVVVNSQQMAMATVRDITQLKELDRHRLRQNEELSLMNTQLERLGYVIAHDLKSPLLNIHALINMLKRELGNQANSKVNNYTRLLDEITLSMMNLITGVAEYSKTGFQHTTEEDVDLNLIVAEVRKLVHFPLNFEFKVSQALPVIRGNKTKVLQVLLNLVNNAVKYNDKPEGKIEIQARANQKVCLINVADNGPGIPMELRGKVFELFRKGAIEKEGSQGIGLAVVKKIIEDRGGRILIEPSIWGGANFVFSWPVEPLAAAAPQTQPHEIALYPDLASF